MHDGKNRFGIACPVGGDEQMTSGTGAGSKLLYKIGVDQTALVMAFFRPGIRKKNTGFIQAMRWKDLIEKTDYILIKDPDIVQLLLLNLLQQSAESRSVDLGSDEKLFRALLCHGQQSLTIAKPDFQSQLLAGRQLLVKLISVNQILWQQVLQRLLLRSGNPALASDKGANGAVVPGGRLGLLGLRAQKKVPCSGEEALA